MIVKVAKRSIICEKINLNSLPRGITQLRRVSVERVVRQICKFKIETFRQKMKTNLKCLLHNWLRLLIVRLLRQRHHTWSVFVGRETNVRCNHVVCTQKAPTVRAERLLKLTSCSEWDFVRAPVRTRSVRPLLIRLDGLVLNGRSEALHPLGYDEGVFTQRRLLHLAGLRIFGGLLGRLG